MQELRVLGEWGPGLSCHPRRTDAQFLACFVHTVPEIVTLFSLGCSVSSLWLCQCQGYCGLCVCDACDHCLGNLPLPFGQSSR